MTLRKHFTELLEFSNICFAFIPLDEKPLQTDLSSLERTQDRPPLNKTTSQPSTVGTMSPPPCKSPVARNLTVPNMLQFEEKAGDIFENEVEERRFSTSIQSLSHRADPGHSRIWSSESELPSELLAGVTKVPS